MAPYSAACDVLPTANSRKLSPDPVTPTLRTHILGLQWRQWALAAVPMSGLTIDTEAAICVASFIHKPARAREGALDLNVSVTLM